MKECDWKALEDEALKDGASAVRRVDVPKVKIGTWPRMKCQFGCRNYGKTLCCPPYVPDLSTTRDFVKDYKNGLLVRYTVPIEMKDVKDWMKMETDINNGLLDVLIKVEKAALMKNYYKAFALKAGRCSLCEKCNLEKCVHPEIARPSLEAFGIDVFALASDNGFDARMFSGPIKELNIYGMVLLD